MGISIAEMLGMELPQDDLATLNSSASAPDDSAEGSTRESLVQGEAEQTSNTSDDVEEAVVQALLSESTVPAQEFAPQLRLREDFDLDHIGLYAVIAHIEQDLAIEIPDTEIASARTLSDLIMVVRSQISP